MDLLWSRLSSFYVHSNFTNRTVLSLQGSYAGARSAHMRVLYPDVVFGAIASSGVTFASLKDWQYYDIIRQFAPADCIKQVETTIVEVDELLSSDKTQATIQNVFGLPNVTHVEDFGSVLSVCSYHLS